MLPGQGSLECPASRNLMQKIDIQFSCSGFDFKHSHVQKTPKNRQKGTYSQVPIKSACTLNYVRDHFGHFMTLLEPLIEHTVQGRANKSIALNQGFQRGKKMAKMDPKIVKRAGTLNRHLRVLTITQGFDTKINVKNKNLIMKPL